MLLFVLDGFPYPALVVWRRSAAGRAKIAAQALWPDPIVTEIAPLKKFYPAEGYHQDYFRKNPNQGYCTFVIKPKVKKLEAKGVIPKN